MGVGPKIQEYRKKAGLTQRDLADRLYVTYQAVSRWENDDAEPSIDTLKKICGILNCPIEKLLGMEQQTEAKEDEKEKEAEKAKETTTIVEKVIGQEAKPILAVCEQCNKPIYESSDLNRINESVRVRSGRIHHVETRQRILCHDCNEKRLQEKRRKEQEQKRAVLAALRKRRIHSFIWPSLVALTLIIIGIVYFVMGNASAGGICFGTSVLAYCFLGTMILNNTFITEMWLDIASWGAIKLPGIIFEFSLDGFLFLIAMKILFFVLGIIAGLLAIAFATFVAMALSLFVYPFALIKNLNSEK